MTSSIQLSAETVITGLLVIFLSIVGIISRREWKVVLYVAAGMTLVLAYMGPSEFISMKDLNKTIIVISVIVLSLSIAYRLVRPPPEPPQAVTTQPSPTENEREGRAEGPPQVSPPVPKTKEPTPTVEKQRGRGGLEFREVPPEKLGVKVPETFTIDFGNNTSTFPRVRLAEGVPFERLSMMKFPGEIPLRIWFDDDGEIRVDATVYDKGGRLGALIKANDFAVLNAAWDRNWDGNAFEIVNAMGIPFFQIERPRENLIRIRGVFITSKGFVLVSTNQGLFGNPTRPVPPPEPLFAYPSDKNFHKRLR